MYSDRFVRVVLSVAHGRTRPNLVVVQVATLQPLTNRVMRPTSPLAHLGVCGCSFIAGQ